MDSGSFSAFFRQAGLSLDDAHVLLGTSERQLRRYLAGEVPVPKLKLEKVMELVGTRRASRPPAKFRFIDLFAGIGGLRIGFEGIGGRCVFTSEWDRWSQKTYAANFPDSDDDHVMAGDIQPYGADPSLIPEFDVLLAGFPCQPFSLAGVSKKNSLGRAHGFDDVKQGNLFFDIERIIRHHRPAAFLLENVKHLQRHDKGRTFEVIRRTLEDELGYAIDFRVISSHPWVPQKRERIFIAGFRKDVGFSLDDFDRMIPQQTEWPRLGDVLHVRRQNIWLNSRRKLAECRPRLGVDIRRRACGVASGDVRWSVA